MATKKAEIIEIKPIEIATLKARIIGDTPLIVHAWSEKAKRMMLEAQQGKKKGKAKERKNPVVDFIDALYWLTEKPVVTSDMDEEYCEELFNKAVADGARFGFPVTGFKQAAISAAYRLGGRRTR